MSHLPGISMTKDRRDLDHLSQNLYSKNLEHRIVGKDTPGPGFYDKPRLSLHGEETSTLTNLRKSTNFTIPKGKR